MTQLNLTLKMTTAQVVETSVTVNYNSPIQDYVHPDDQTQPFVPVSVSPQIDIKRVPRGTCVYSDNKDYSAISGSTMDVELQ